MSKLTRLSDLLKPVIGSMIILSQVKPVGLLLAEFTLLDSDRSESIMPDPLFELFQIVEVIAITESNVYKDQARVTGVIYRSPDAPRSLWAYQITYEGEIESSPWLDIPFSEIVAEDELRAI